MASETTVEVAEDNTRAVTAAIDRAILKALLQIGMLAEGYAKIACPVDTGRLRASITNQVDSSDSAVYIGTNVEYARYVELGTSKMKAQPYLKPAAKNHTSQYRQIVRQALENA